LKRKAKVEVFKERKKKEKKGSSKEKKIFVRKLMILNYSNFQIFSPSNPYISFESLNKLFLRLENKENCI